ncbi:MAG TPA: hypothetical protein VFY96_05410 [Candidatus Binatia bacterium]|nr:hypothetical protein [Candidatus Binatia bacterium]
MLEPDYTGFTLVELFTARYSMDKFSRESSLEREIQKRCEHIRQQVNGNRGASEATAFKPYGLRVGVMLFCLTVGPFLISTFFDAISLIKGLDDTVTLSGVWALVTLPGLVMISMIGGRIDAERIIKRFKLSGDKPGENTNCFYEVINAL